MGNDLRKVRAYETTRRDVNGSLEPIVVLGDSVAKAEMQVSEPRVEVKSKFIGWADVDLYGSEPDLMVKTKCGKEFVVGEDHPSFKYMQDTFAPLLREIERVKEEEEDD